MVSSTTLSMELNDQPQGTLTTLNLPEPILRIIIEISPDNTKNPYQTCWLTIEKDTRHQVVLTDPGGYQSLKVALARKNLGKVRSPFLGVASWMLLPKGRRSSRG